MKLNVSGIFTALMTVAVFLTSSSGFVNAQNFQEINFDRVASGLSRPVYATYAGGDSNRLFVVEQHTKRIRILDLGTNSITGIYLTLPSAVATGNEQGLLGLAFHPDYASNGKFYVNFTNSSGDTQIQEFTRTNANTADPASARNIISFNQPFSNHNGGWIGFDPDGMLIVASGDGGSGGDPQGNGQDITDNKLGKLLRLDIDGDDFPGDANRNYAIPANNPFVGIAGDDELFAYGLRNPWRCSFDRLTDDLWIGDVGQGAREEVSVMLAPTLGGQNYGWKNREGMLGSQPPGGSVNPIYNYSHGSGTTQGFSITGGYVYRGPVAGLDGHYFFADYVNNRLWSLKLNGNNEAAFDGTNYTDFTYWSPLIQTDVGNVNSIASFAEDEFGNLYIVDLGGEIFKLTDVSEVTITESPEAYAVSGGGQYRDGDLTDLESSDDSYLNFNKDSNAVNSSIFIELTGTSHTADPTAFAITYEGATIGGPAFDLKIELFNYTTGAYEIVDERVASKFVDEVVDYDATGNLSRFVQPGTLQTKARLHFKTRRISRLRFRLAIDQFIWTITN